MKVEVGRSRLVGRDLHRSERAWYHGLDRE
jgi:hypothetical protein